MVARMAADRGLAHEHGGLIASAKLIGSLQIQSRATIAGNLANASPASDIAPFLLAL